MRVGQRSVAGPGDEEIVEPLGVHKQAPASLRSAEPFLSRGGIELAADRVHVERHGAQSLSAIQEDRHAGGGQPGRIDDLSAHPGDVRAGDQPGPAR